MAQDQTKKEALFNEVKGSLFEYLVAKELAQASSAELEFQKSLDTNYLTVLTQQDRMVRQFYPEMVPFLSEASKLTKERLITYFKEIPHSPKLLGKFSQEADLILTSSHGQIPLSLKLNKKNAFVNTKSGGVKSFFESYFSFLPQSFQQDFNKLVDIEFNRMAVDLHELHELDYPGNFSLWVQKGFSELPGELDEGSRKILKDYYARIAKDMHRIIEHAQKLNPLKFSEALAPLMGFSSKEIIQVTCFHDFKSGQPSTVQIHSFSDLKHSLKMPQIQPFGSISSIEISVGEWSLQIRVKPMNKFTTTAIKINCSIKLFAGN